MSTDVLLQGFIIVDVFFMGAVAATAVRHAYAHYRPSKHEPEKTTVVTASDHLPADVKDRLLKDSQAKFETTLSHAANLMLHDLDATSEEINGLVKRLATEVVGDELERYRADLTKLHTQAEKELGGIKQAVDSHQTELKAKLAEDMEAEKKRLIQQIDTKLADAVGSFLLETLQHNIDLGSQTPYLTELLEEHKADFVKEVSDDAQPAK